MKFSTHSAIMVRGGRVIDPISGRDGVADLAVVDGVIAKQAPPEARIIEASGWIVCPGFIDLHVHLREPGQAHKETIETGTAAAAAGGFTFVACMPNTSPPIDDPDTLRWVLNRARQVDYCAVGPVAAITQGRHGEKLTDFAALRKAGAVAFSDDGDGVESDHIMRGALRMARELGVVVIQHCENKEIAAGGVMHKGAVSRRLGLPGLDPRAEEAMIERDITLCRETGGRYHVAHISTARAVELIRHAKADGVPVTTEICPHHLILTDEACAGRDPNAKMHPPLRTQADVDACRRGLIDGTIDCIVTDHAPHTSEEKARGFLKAPPGIIGLETAVGLAAYVLIDSGLADWPQVIRWLSNAPAAVLDLPRNRIETGSTADLTLIDPDARWTVEPAQLASKSRNTPFAGWTLSARPVGTIRGRRVGMRCDLPS